MARKRHGAEEIIGKLRAAKPQKRQKVAPSSSASASFTSDRSCQTASSSALNIDSGGQAGWPLAEG
ncbi:hypothetical protein FHS88_004054 [Roseomonas alkaliterrae]|uniref:Uncharacterized protein n=1 Tax=Neoroseomonas alkaliterrae TaxID=1452450 RepID=A0A840YD94_9PROT|nr:hypothetical protein [Neoroseomonas alkaliterrae]